MKTLRTDVVRARRIWICLGRDNLGSPERVQKGRARAQRVHQDGGTSPWSQPYEARDVMSMVVRSSGLVR